MQALKTLFRNLQTVRASYSPTNSYDHFIYFSMKLEHDLQISTFLNQFYPNYIIK